MQKTKPAKAKTTQTALNFTALVDAIRQAHAHCAAAANRAVNTSLTLRNWIIGAYIHHYELHGADRAEYGERLLNKLAQRLGNEQMERTELRELRRFRAFYLAYPQIRETVPTEFETSFPWQFGRQCLPNLLPEHHRVSQRKNC